MPSISFCVCFFQLNIQYEEVAISLRVHYSNALRDASPTDRIHMIENITLEQMNAIVEVKDKIKAGGRAFNIGC